MPNTLLTSSLITREALMVLENDLSFTKGVNKDYSENFGNDSAIGQKIGDTVSARIPPRYVGRTGAALSVEDATETSVPVKLTTQAGVDIKFSMKDLTLSIDDFSDRFIKPAIANIANRIDYDGMALYKNIYNSVGTPGTALYAAGGLALKPYTDAAVKLDNCAAPRDGQRNAVISAQSQADLVVGLSGLFQDSSDISRQYREGTMGKTAGLKFSMDQNVNAMTVGAQGGTPLVDGASQTGSTLNTKGWTAAAAARLNVGDVFTIANVFSVNPQSHQIVPGVLQQFVVTAAFSSGADGKGAISISPSIITGTGFQTVNASPADGAAITVVGAAGTVSTEQLVFHRDAFTLVAADLELPRGVDFAARKADKRTGLSVRIVRAYDINTDNMPCRLDVLYGWACLRPELACRVRY
jgi:P22 coat protein - gene protein 5